MFTSLFTKTGFAALIALSICSANKQSKKLDVDPNKTVIVELFTSEGCSSCPAADAAVERVSKEYGSKIIVLAYHVDYWDRLGWKDQFSSAAFSLRQANYATAMKLESLYTPQVIVDGAAQFVGSNERLLHSSINSALQGDYNPSIKITANTSTKQMVAVNYEVAVTKNKTLNIALVQSMAETVIKHGENGGRKLKHINIVRDLKTFTPSMLQGTLLLKLPEGLSAVECKVIAFMQDKTSYGITNGEQCFIQ